MWTTSINYGGSDEKRLDKLLTEYQEKIIKMLEEAAVEANKLLEKK